MYELSTRYPQKRAFITGAASGLGKAFALELAADGFTIGLADINATNLETVGREVKIAGGNPLIYQLDVSDKEAYKIVAEKFLADAGGIDLLFNNAGVGDGGAFEAYALENYEWMININQLGVLYGCWYFIPAMKQQKSGHILNTASAAAIGCAPTMGAYNMTKAAVVAISETLYGELMDDGIHVSCIQPTYFKTNIAESARGGALIKKVTQKFIDRSGLEAKEVAQEILHRAGKKELYIILPKDARKMWFFKRLAPTWFRKKVKEQFMYAMHKAAK
ncbi:MAG: SDR family NAD(P)-dependent oxidoreductase [Sediminibacterium sp.]|nr:SDR family NAD(P)-dependent oxidoreductase [Sediminibacterium sp.]